MNSKEVKDIAMVKKLHTQLATEQFLKLIRLCGEEKYYGLRKKEEKHDSVFVG